MNSMTAFPLLLLVITSGFTLAEVPMNLLPQRPISAFFSLAPNVQEHGTPAGERDFVRRI